ncbi:MAG: gephyrin-like molybdotransferase Glp [bacterium]
MITFDQAYEIITTAARPLGTESVLLQEVQGRVLAQDVVCDVDMPPFDKSAMDGFACRRQDLDQALRIIEEIPAGHFPQKTIGHGECARIMTGAPVPAGADLVIMVEDTRTEGENAVRFTGSRTASNICTKGEDVKTGDLVLQRGTILTPARMGALCAALGKPDVLVYRRAKVGLIATGDELVEPWQRPPAAGIRNTNSYQLSAQIRAMGATVAYHGIVGDRREDLLLAVQKAVTDCDLLLLSGGVSVGAYDFGAESLAGAGYQLLFQSVAMQPGKPTLFGRSKERFCCGMPGNPVSTFVVFELLIKPFLYGLMGHTYLPHTISAELEADISLKNSNRQTTVPVIFTEAGKVAPLEYHGSAHIHAIARADALLIMPAGSGGSKKGSLVHVRPI